MFDTLSASLPHTLSPIVLWVLYGLALLLWAIFAGILWYHWDAYDAESKRVRRIKRIFFIGSIVILLLAVTFIFSL